MLPDYVLNYVADAPKSAALYRQLLEAEPVESSDKFAMFRLPNGTALALWAFDAVEPRATLPGGSELCFSVESDDAVRRTPRRLGDARPPHHPGTGADGFRLHLHRRRSGRTPAAGVQPGAELERSARTAS